MEVVWKKDGLTEAEAAQLKTASSDRLALQDLTRHNECRMKAVGNKGQGWDNVEPAEIETFLSAYFNQSVTLMGITKETDRSFGGRVWNFHYLDASPEALPG